MLLHHHQRLLESFLLNAKVLLLAHVRPELQAVARLYRGILSLQKLYGHFTDTIDVVP